MSDESSTTSSTSGTDTGEDRSTPPEPEPAAGTDDGAVNRAADGDGDTDPDPDGDVDTGAAADGDAEASDEAVTGDGGSGTRSAPEARTGPVETAGRREVVVPPRLYKTVTVFSTLLAVGAVVGGFVLIDEATGRATRRLAEVNVPLAALGLGLIVGGAVQYAYAQRFRAGGMATDKSDGDGNEDDG